MYTFQNANQALIGMSRELVNAGVWRETRGFRCLEIPHPVMVEITNPADRYITIPERKWNPYLPFVESLWMALGLNDLDVLPGHYVKALYNYSDNGRTWRAGYGPRLRAFRGHSGDYDISEPHSRHIFSGNPKIVDQLKYVVDSFERDPHTRQAVVQLGDPAKDCYNDQGELLVTKDYPCSRVLQFMAVDGALNCTLYIRSNDILFGFSAVNVFNFTWMQEYLAYILGLKLGRYYHVANNLHVYDEHYEKIKHFAGLRLEDYESRYGINYVGLDYPRGHETPSEGFKVFNDDLEQLYRYEQLVRSDYVDAQAHFSTAMFRDWAKVFLHYARKRRGSNIEVVFQNPYLNVVFK